LVWNARTRTVLECGSTEYNGTLHCFLPIDSELVVAMALDKQFNNSILKAAK